MKRSTCRLMFAHDSAIQKKGETFVEVEDLFHATMDNHREYSKNKFQDSRFWRAISTRYWQFDDFNFEGAAAASFLGSAHRYKIWINPQEVYKLLMTAAMGLYDKSADGSTKSKGKRKGKKAKAVDEKTPEEIAEEMMKNQIEWDNLIQNKSKDSKRLSEIYGWNHELWIEMDKSKAQGYWTDLGWNLWNHAIINFDYISNNMVGILIHEMMHVLWQHLKRNKMDPYHWNLATDYSINQVVDFTPEIQTVCITSRNETFFNRFVISYVRYHLMQNVDDRKQAEKKYGLTVSQPIQEFCETAFPHIQNLYQDYMVDGSTYDRTDITSKKPADFYYRILEETMIFSDGEGEGEGEGEGSGKGKGKGSGVRGYDNHGQWSDESDEDDDEGEDSDEDSDEEKDGKGKGKGNKDGEGEEKGKGNEDGDKNKEKVEGGKIDQKRKASKGGKAKKSSGGSSGGANVKERGKGEGEGSPHGGWDVTTACARQEAKGSVRDAMKRAGFNPDDPADLEKCLDRTPGMESLGAYISDWFKVPTKNWRQILNHYIASAMKPQQLDYTMSRENRRLPGVFPGQRRERGLELILGVDVSGSINFNDYNDFIGQIQKIGRDCDIDNVRFIQCHHSICLDKKMPLRRIKTTPVVEVGGTTMRVVYETLKREKNRKLLILFTDGCIDMFKNEGWGFKSIMFLSRGNECYAESLRERGFPVICQDSE